MQVLWHIGELRRRLLVTTRCFAARRSTTIRQLLELEFIRHALVVENPHHVHRRAPRVSLLLWHALPDPDAFAVLLENRIGLVPARRQELNARYLFVVYCFEEVAEGQRLDTLRSVRTTVIEPLGIRTTKPLVGEESG